MTRAATFVGLVVTLALAACGSPSKPQAGSQTNWLAACDSTAECGDLECVCGVCTAPCDGDAACADLPGAVCVDATDEGAIAFCGGHTPPSNLCLAECDPSCPEGTTCTAGMCTPTSDASVRVLVDTTAPHETLVGFGASLSYTAGNIVTNPDRQALYDFAFVESGLDVLRLTNLYNNEGEIDVSAASEIVAEAAARIGRRPLLFMTSASPPAALKANGSLACAGNPETCTLAALPTGGFDYDSFAAFWRTSLERYADAGITPDYIGIQNDPNWVPSADQRLQACRFLPEEGTMTVSVGDADVGVTYPGYREALAAVRAAISDLPVVPRFIAPEAGELGLTAEYAAALDPSSFDALAIHLYDMDTAALDSGAFSDVRDLAQQIGRPVFQTEMQAGGMETAILVHHSFVTGGASAYMQNDLASWAPEVAPITLVFLTGDGFEPQGPSYALAHFAKYTDPGWIRIDATSNTSDVLGSAWMAPDGSALTVVLVNPSSEEREPEIVLPDGLRATLTASTVMRTVFEGTERSAVLGELPPSGVVQLPGRSIATVALSVR